MAQINFASEAQEYKDVLKEKAEDLVFEGFPAKIIELNQLLNTPLFKKNKAEIPENLNVDIPEMIGLVKPHMRKLVENFNLVKMWITYLIPKMKRGENVTVSILHEILAKVTIFEKEGNNYFAEISGYHNRRAKLVSKVAKYPQIDDFRRSVAVLDEEMYHTLWHILCKVRNRYCYLHDFIIKNLETFRTNRPAYNNIIICSYAE